MSLWNQLVQLKPSVMDQLQVSYGEHFPLEIRQYLAEWLEMRLLYTVTDVEQSIEAGNFFEELLGQLQMKASQLAAENNIMANMRLLESARQIRQTFATDTLQLLKHLRACLQFENNLVRNPKVYSRKENKEDGEIMGALEALLLKMREIESENRLIRQQYEEFHLKYHEVAKFNAQSEYWLIQNPDMAEKVAVARGQRNEALQKILNSVEHRKLCLAETFKGVVAECLGIGEVVTGTYLSEWQMNQKIAAMGGTVKSSVKLDTIQKWCEDLAHILWTTREQVKISISLRQHVQNDRQMVYDELQSILNDVSRHLENLISRSFVIESQPPQVIGTNKKFGSTVRLLIGNKLSISMETPQVTATIISEQQAKQMRATNECMEDCGKIINNIGFMEYNESSKKLSLSLCNMKLLPSLPKEMNKIRKERTGTEKVVDKKFALLFQTRLTIGHGELSYTVWTHSLPIVVTSHTNQKADAWATITWDNAFSELVREPFVVPDKVPVTRLANALNLKFRAKTGGNLTQENLHFLCEKATRMKLPLPLSDDYEVTWAQFCKDSLPGRDFSFWIWFYKIMKLTKKYLSGPWNDKLVMGFVDKEIAEGMLRNCPNGTFLLRFSESECGGVTIALMQNKFVTHIEPFTEETLKIRSLADSICDLHHMTYLYPNKPMQEAFARYMTPKQVNVKGNYVKSEFRMAVLVNHVQACSAASMENPQNRFQDGASSSDFYMDFDISLPNFSASFYPPSSSNYDVYTSTC